MTTTSLCMPTTGLRKVVNKLISSTWWAHFGFTRINITPTILCKKIEDLREARASTRSQVEHPKIGVPLKTAGRSIVVPPFAKPCAAFIAGQRVSLANEEPEATIAPQPMRRLGSDRSWHGHEMPKTLAIIGVSTIT